MGYTTNPGMVLVQRFKRNSGKWHDDTAVDMSDFYHVANIHDACEAAIGRVIGYDLEQWIYVIAEPYHMYAHPIMLKKLDRF